MRADSAGGLRHRLVLERPLRAAEAGGGASVEWTEEAEVWCAVRPLRGEERVVAQQVSGRLSHEIVMRFRQGVGPAMRLRQGPRTFLIDAVWDVGERRAWLKCLCREEGL